MNLKQFSIQIILFINLFINFHTTCMEEKNKHNGNYYTTDESHLDFKHPENITDHNKNKLDPNKEYRIKIVSPKNFQTSISGLTVKNHFQSPEKVEMLINQLANRAQILNNQNLIITIEITQDRQNASCIIL